MNVASKFGKNEVVIIAEDVSGHVWRGVAYFVNCFYNSYKKTTKFQVIRETLATEKW